ncbi:MAG: c-type cytochrome biogenesis protein CcmI, partial [Rhizobiales bacterium 32-66-8]
AVMTALAIMAVLWPLSRQRAMRDGRAADVAVYRDQLAELERDAAAGRLPPEQAAAARVEVARRMLAADAAPDPAPAAGARLRRRLTAIAALALIPLFGVGLYLKLGSPALPGAPLAERLAAAPDRSDVAILVRKVEDHLAANPTDGPGYEIIAPVYLRLGRVDDAVRAYAQAIRILGSTAERQAALGEALVVKDQGIVTSDAVRAFQAALALDPTMPKAQYFLGLAAEQDGRRADAVAIWTKLAETSPPNAPWLGLVRAALTKAGAPMPAQAQAPAQQGPASVRLPPPASPGVGIPGPTAQDMQAAAGMNSEQRSAMVLGMVERLEQRLADSPKDLDGWLRLARAWRVLGDEDKVRAALASARAAFAGDAESTARIDATAKELGVAG